MLQRSALGYLVLMWELCGVGCCSLFSTDRGAGRDVPRAWCYGRFSTDPGCLVLASDASLAAGTSVAVLYAMCGIATMAVLYAICGVATSACRCLRCAVLLYMENS